MAVIPMSFVGLVRHLLPGWSLVAQSRPGSCAHSTLITVYHREPGTYDVVVEEDGAPSYGAWGLSDLPYWNQGEIVFGGLVRVVIDPLTIGTMSLRPVMHPHNDLMWQDLTAQEKLESSWPDMEAGNVALRIRRDDGDSYLYVQDGLTRTVRFATANGISDVISPYTQVPRDRIVDVEAVPIVVELE